MRSVISEFFKRIESGEIHAYTSALTFDEHAYRLILALIKDKYGGSPLVHLRERETALLKEFAPVFIPKLELLSHFPNLQLIEITAHDVESMLRNILQYSLKPRDALHLSVMQRLPCFNLASGDHHFDVAPEIKRFSVLMSS